MVGRGSGRCENGGHGEQGAERTTTSDHGAAPDEGPSPVRAGPMPRPPPCSDASYRFAPTDFRANSRGEGANSRSRRPLNPRLGVAKNLGAGGPDGRGWVSGSSSRGWATWPGRSGRSCRGSGPIRSLARHLGAQDLSAVFPAFTPDPARFPGAIRARELVEPSWRIWRMREQSA